MFISVNFHPMMKSRPINISGIHPYHSEYQVLNVMRQSGHKEPHPIQWGQLPSCHVWHPLINLCSTGEPPPTPTPSCRPNHLPRLKCSSFPAPTDPIHPGKESLISLLGVILLTNIKNNISGHGTPCQNYVGQTAKQTQVVRLDLILI